MNPTILGLFGSHPQVQQKPGFRVLSRKNSRRTGPGRTGRRTLTGVCNMEDQDQRVSQVLIKTKSRGSHELLAKVEQDTRNKAKVEQDTRIKLGPA